MAGDMTSAPGHAVSPHVRLGTGKTESIGSNGNTKRKLKNRPLASGRFGRNKTSSTDMSGKTTDAPPSLDGILNDQVPREAEGGANQYGSGLTAEGLPHLLNLLQNGQQEGFQQCPKKQISKVGAFEGVPPNVHNMPEQGAMFTLEAEDLDMLDEAATIHHFFPQNQAMQVRHAAFDRYADASFWDMYKPVRLTKDVLARFNSCFSEELYVEVPRLEVNTKKKLKNRRLPAHDLQA